MEKKSGDFLNQDAAKLTSSSAFQEIITKLFQQNASEIEHARKLASDGKSENAVQELSKILNSPEIQTLISQLEASDGRLE